MRRAYWGDSAGECGPVRDPEGPFIIRWGGAAAAGRRRRPCTGSEREAQRTPRSPCPAVAIV